MPMATYNPTTASTMTTISTPSPTKTFKRWGLSCPFCAQSTPNPSPVDSDWSKEDWDGEIEKRKEKQRKEEEMMQRQDEEKKILDPNYYLPEPIYIPSYEEPPLHC